MCVCVCLYVCMYVCMYVCFADLDVCFAASTHREQTLQANMEAATNDV